MIGRTNTLTFSSTETSGITLDEYIAKAYAIDVIQDMIDILQWQLRIDESDNVFFEPKGNVNNGATFTSGTDGQIIEWEEDESELFNRVRIIGGFENIFTQETKSGSSTTFALDHKPTGTFKATVSGNEVDPDDYKVNAETPEVVFTSSKTDPTFDYSYNRPVIVEDQNDVSIADREDEIYQEIEAPWLTSLETARVYASSLIDVFSIPLVRAIGLRPNLDFDTSVGELITVSDPIRGKTAQLLVIEKIELIAESNETKYTFGPRTFVLDDWQARVQDRIKKLERRLINVDTIAFSRLFKHNMKVTLSITKVFEFNSPVNSFVVGHRTLGRAIKDFNTEVDCSDNDRDGTWSGTGIGGSQYSTSGFRLSTGQFNGSDRIITVSDVAALDLNSDFSIVLAVKVNPLPGALTYIMNKWDGTNGWAVRINASNKVELIYSNSGADTVFAANTALSANTFQHIVFTKSGTDLVVYIQGSSDNTDTGDAAAGINTEDVIVGKYSSNFFSGDCDEVRLYDRALTAAEVSDTFNKIHVMDNNVLYLSMDNPRVGDFSDGRATVV